MVYTRPEVCGDQKDCLKPNSMVSAVNGTTALQISGTVIGRSPPHIQRALAVEFVFKTSSPVPAEIPRVVGGQWDRGIN